MTNEYAIEMAASSIRFGWGVTRKLGMDLAEGKVRRVLVVTDPNFERACYLDTIEVCSSSLHGPTMN